MLTSTVELSSSNIITNIKSTQSVPRTSKESFLAGIDIVKREAICLFLCHRFGENQSLSDLPKDILYIILNEIITEINIKSIIELRSHLLSQGSSDMLAWHFDYHYGDAGSPIKQAEMFYEKEGIWPSKILEDPSKLEAISRRYESIAMMKQ